MKQSKPWDLLHLFGEGDEGETQQMPDPTPQATRTGGTEESALVAGETATAKTRQEEFRSLIEGEYKDLFTAYFQETFNRRFREQKGMIEELEAARGTLRAAAEFFGVPESELAQAIRAENEKKRAPTDATQVGKEHTEEERLSRHEVEEELRRVSQEAAERARRETEEALMGHIRARGLRPAEAALSAESARALTAGVASLSREQRAEVARRAAKGEQIRF